MRSRVGHRIRRDYQTGRRGHEIRLHVDHQQLAAGIALMRNAEIAKPEVIQSFHATMMPYPLIDDNMRRK